MDNSHYYFSLSDEMLSIFPCQDVTQSGICLISQVFCRSIITHFSLPQNCVDLSIYTGLSGAVYALWRYQRHFPEEILIPSPEDMLLCNWEYAKQQVSKHQGRTSLIAKAAGFFLVSCLVLQSSSQQKYIEALRFVVEHVEIVASSASLPCEHLYGAAGALYAIRFLRKHVLHTRMQDAASRLDRAESLLVRKILHSEAPQGWEWHGKFYVGAAHGLSGVLLGLLRLPLHYHKDTALMQTIKNKVRLLLTDCKYEPQRIYSDANTCRNFKSSVGSQSDRLVQWCHGAPGVLPVLVELIKHPEILANGDVFHEIQNAVLVVQQRGLLRKGLGLCHGIAGNMYTLLEAQARSPSRTSEENTIQSYLLCMLNHTTLRDNGIMGVGDAEFSLFEGQAGALVCLVDYLESLTGGLCEGFPFYSDC
eukprot:gene25255-30498_t